MSGFRVRGMGLELFVHEWGAGDRIALLLHGLQDVGATWDAVAPVLVDAGFHVLAPDLRGFGDSGRVADSGYYHFPDYVFDVAELVDAVSPRAPIALVGHSMGGTVAGMYAGAYPDRVRKLALVEGIGPPAVPEGDIAVDRTRAWIDGVRKQRGRAERPLTLPMAVDRLRINHPHVDDETLRRRALQLTRPAIAQCDDSFSTGDGPSAGSELRVWNFDALHRTRSPTTFSVERWRSHARCITAPTLYVGGGPTGFHPEDTAERLATIADVRRVDIDGAGHMIHWTKPAELARVLVDFLA